MSGRWLDVIAVIFTPAWWLRNYTTSAALTDYIAQQLDAGEAPEILSCYTMRLGNVELWRANFPYAYGSLESPSVVKALPSRAVARRLRRAELAASLPPPTPDEKIRAALAKAEGREP